MFVFNFVQLLGLVQFRHVCFVAVLHVFWTCFSLAVLVGWQAVLLLCSGCVLPCRLVC